MWNAIYLEGVAIIQQLNLEVAVTKLCEAINKKNLCGVKVSRSTSKKIIKAQNLLRNKKSQEDVVYELIKTKGLSKRVFKRSLHYFQQGNVDIFYVNYKFLDYIVCSIVKYILIVDKTILDDLFVLSKNTYGGEDSITFRTIPVRRVLTQNIAREYNDREECALKSEYFQKKIFLLDKKLDEVDLVIGGVL